jgi:2-methylcitrate dehydratase
MTYVEQLARFVLRASYGNLSKQARQQLKIRVLDALGCAIGAIGNETTAIVRKQVDKLGEKGSCTLIGGGKTAPDRAALYNSTLVRYLDFNDAYLARRETCHPSDNLGAVLAACEYAGASGRDLLAALAVAYQVQCRLSDVAPVRARGFDHTTQGSFAVAAGVSKALGLDQAKTANALAIAGTAFNALRVTRTGVLSNWKGLAFANMAFGVTNSTFLAMRGITGPEEVFEGNKGFMQTISGHFELDWSKEDLERVNRTIVKKYNAEIHSQSAIEGLLELKAITDSSSIQLIEVDIFDVAYNIIGGGEEGDKLSVRSKEAADHSLPYILAAALLDGQVMPAQFLPERIMRRDVQALMRKVQVTPQEEYSRRFPEEMPACIRIHFGGGLELTKEKSDYEGFHTHPMSWETAVVKFEQLTKGHMNESLREEIELAVLGLESIRVRDLTELLEKVK